MKHGSLFSGIGGFDLAAEWMGWENVFHCEWNEFGQRILKHYWPKAISYEDITKTDFSIHRGKIDILSGGFPCQPYSQAGKRLGKEDDRHLWPEMLRAIREVQPQWVVGENVLGIVNWSGGLVFDEVQTELEAEGYEVQPYVLPACSVNAPHRRDRVWFVAYVKGRRFGGLRNEGEETRTSEGNQSSGGKYRMEADERATTYSNGTEQGNRRGKDIEAEGSLRGNETGDVLGELSSVESVADTVSRKREIGRKYDGMGRFRKQVEKNRWGQFPTQHPFCNGNDGISSRLDGITFSKWRNESIKGAGNAIVPQVALQIFKAIEQYNIGI